QRLRLRSTLADAGRTGCVVVSTHHTDEAAALCSRLIVVHRGRIQYDGDPRGLADAAAGHVWVDVAAGPTAIQSWTVADGSVRCLGTPPAGARLVDPTLDEGYLWLTHGTDGAPWAPG